MSILERPSRRTLLSATGLGLGAALLAACGSEQSAGSDGLSVVTSAYPLAFLVSRIGGEHVSLTDLSTPGVDAHGLELSVKQVMAIEQAALVLQIPGFQNALDDAIASHGADNVLDVSSVITLLPADAASAHEEHGTKSAEEHAEHAEEDPHAGESAQEHAEHAEEGADEHSGDSAEEHAEHAEEGGDGHDHGAFDPHFWHDPLRMADLGDAVADRLAELSPESSSAFTEAAAALRTELEELDTELAESFDAVQGEKPFVASHAAYIYLAEHYGLHQIGIAGVDPETEPSPQRLLALEKIVDAEGVTTIFFETSASPKVAQTLAKNLGIDSEELDNLATQLNPDSDYPQVMRENRDKLVASWM